MSTENQPLPAVVDRATWQAARDAQLAREKAHTREGDALAAARRRLPMVEVDGALPLIGTNGQVTLLDAFEGRRQLVAYYFMWWTGHSAAEQCEGCTFFNGQVRELSYLHSRDITYATLCQGPYEPSARYRDFMGWDAPGTRPRTPRTRSSEIASGRRRRSCATCATAARCTRRTGPAAAAWR